MAIETATRAVTVRRLSARIGAELSGVTLRQAGDEQIAGRHRVCRRFEAEGGDAEGEEAEEDGDEEQPRRKSRKVA